MLLLVLNLTNFFPTSCGFRVPLYTTFRTFIESRGFQILSEVSFFIIFMWKVCLVLLSIFLTFCWLSYTIFNIETLSDLLQLTNKIVIYIFRDLFGNGSHILTVCPSDASVQHFERNSVIRCSCLKKSWKCAFSRIQKVETQFMKYGAGRELWGGFHQRFLIQNFIRCAQLNRVQP